MNGSRARAVVTGLAATYPFGGVFWDYMQYAIGLRGMGYDVLYLEDTGRWSYEPRQRTFVPSGAWGADYLALNVDGLDPAIRPAWFYRDSLGQEFGIGWQEVVSFCRSADVFLHISASCWMRDEYFEAGTVVFVDSDPMYTQASVPDYVTGAVDDAGRSRVEMLKGHDAFFTFGENIGSSGCAIPTDVFDWKPTRQPIAIESLEKYRRPVAERRRVLTTVGSWQSSEGDVWVRGVRYGGKGDELRRFIDLPSKSPVPLELAMSGRTPVDEFKAHGWQMADAFDVSSSPAAYRDYLAASLGEWSVAKNAYVASRSGWFSCRSATYLALGVPVVVQQTGFRVPTGAGVLGFEDPSSAVAAIQELVSDPERHSVAATDIAFEYFRADRVLGELLESATASAPSRSDVDA